MNLLLTNICSLGPEGCVINDDYDIYKEFGSNYKRKYIGFYVQENKEIICSGKIDPKIILVTPKYNPGLVMQFNYLNSFIIMEEKECILRHMPDPHKFKIFNLIMVYVFVPWEYEVEGITCEDVQFVYPVDDKKLKVVGMDISKINPRIVQSILDHFEEIEMMYFHSKILQYLDVDRFSNIIIRSVTIDLIDNANIDVIASNNHITSLTLFGNYDCKLTMVNESLRSIKYESTINGSREIPEWINENKICFKYGRFAKTKAIIPN